MDKKLVGKDLSNNCSKCLNVQVEIRDECCLSVIHMGDSAI